MCAGRSSVLHIGSNPAEAFSSSRTGGGYNDLAVVVHQATLESLLFPWIRAREDLTKFGSLAALSI